MTALQSPSYKPSTVSPQFVEESSDFLQLFPHRYDYLWAEHPNPGDRPEWQTESRHPLSDRLILQGAYLYGVRFGSFTSYLLIDIDKNSTHHPSRNPYAIGEIVAALEAIGLISYIAICSSDSGGIHLYFPWGVPGQDSPSMWAAMAEAVDEPSQSVVPHCEPLPSWAIAQAAESALIAAGFKLVKGHLEVFPNPKRYGDTANYNGHRLPLQAGSFLLDEDFQPIFSSRDRFVEQWKFASSRNCPTRQLIDEAIARLPRPWKKIGRSAQKFLNDLNAEINAGWTGPGQTNNLLGKLVLREYVFGHLFIGKMLRGVDLEWRVFSLIQELPGFRQHCRHVLDIAKRVGEWVRCVETNPRYYPYGGTEKLQSDGIEKPIAENEKRSLEAMERITAAVKFLMRVGQFPKTVLNRIQAIREYLRGSSDQSISVETLYKNKHLWHPDYVAESPDPLPDGSLRAVVEDSDTSRSPDPLPDGSLRAVETISFYAPSPDPQGGGAYVERAVGGSGGLSTGPEPPQGIEIIKQKLAEIRQRTAQRQTQRWQERAEIPPDENWFAQQRLPLEVVSNE